MKDCCICGKPVRLGAYRITINRKRGVAHYIAHRDGSAMHGSIWECFSFKPYPNNEEDKNWNKLMQRWNACNPVEVTL